MSGLGHQFIPATAHVVQFIIFMLRGRYMCLLELPHPEFMDFICGRFTFPKITICLDPVRVPFFVVVCHEIPQY